MSPQVRHFKAMIAAIQQDREAVASISFVREVCKGVAESAPVDDLISLALFCVELGLKAERDQIGNN